MRSGGKGDAIPLHAFQNAPPFKAGMIYFQLRGYPARECFLLRIVKATFMPSEAKVAVCKNLRKLGDWAEARRPGKDCFGKKFSQFYNSHSIILPGIRSIFTHIGSSTATMLPDFHI